MISKIFSKKNNIKEQGVTMVALVTTIAIMIILAAVTINMATSDNGLISKAQNATEKI